VENEAGEMVWQPAEGGEAVSAAEWSRVASGEEPGDKPGETPTVKAEEAPAEKAAAPPEQAPVEEQKPDEKVEAVEPGEPEITA
jgi:hypothetical protein